MKISLSSKELDFKPFLRTAVSHKFFMIGGSWVPPASRVQPKRYTVPPLLFLYLFTSKWHRAALWFDRKLFLIPTTTRHLLSLPQNEQHPRVPLPHLCHRRCNENSGGRSSHLSPLKRWPPYLGSVPWRSEGSGHLLPRRPRSSGARARRPMHNLLRLTAGLPIVSQGEELGSADVSRSLPKPVCFYLPSPDSFRSRIGYGR